MAEKSAFEKIHIDESEKSNVEGLLEQLNLPPSVITFVRDNKRLVQISTAVIIITVVVWALYGSYRDNRIENASSALTAAMNVDGQPRIEALTKVAEKFKGTSAALWANINKAHGLANTDKIDEAIALYLETRQECGKNSTLRPLLANSLAQLYEETEKYDNAISEYQYLKSKEGYEGIGYLGLARTYELMSDKEKALLVYEEYMALLNEKNVRSEKMLVEAKIARIKATL